MINQLTIQNSVIRRGINANSIPYNKRQTTKANETCGFRKNGLPLDIIHETTRPWGGYIFLPKRIPLPITDNPDPPKEIIRIVLSESRCSWDGTPYPNKKVTDLKLIIPPKYEIRKHEHDCIVTGYVERGEITIVTEEKKCTFSCGQIINETLNKPHSGIAGNKGATLVVHFEETVSPIQLLKSLIQGLINFLISFVVTR